VAVDCQRDFTFDRVSNADCRYCGRAGCNRRSVFVGPRAGCEFIRRQAAYGLGGGRGRGHRFAWTRGTFARRTLVRPARDYHPTSVPTAGELRFWVFENCPLTHVRATEISVPTTLPGDRHFDVASRISKGTSTTLPDTFVATILYSSR
jgi:hypothetical protein